MPEVILAREAGICYQAVAMSTDYDCWKEGEEAVTWELVVERMRQNSDNVKKLILDVIPRIDFYECDAMLVCQCFLLQVSLHGCNKQMNE